MCLYDIYLTGNLSLPTLHSGPKCDKLCKGSIEIYCNNDNNILCLLLGYDAWMTKCLISRSDQREREREIVVKNDILCLVLLNMFSTPIKK